MNESRYVILYHKLTDSEHWDLMLERGELLATWQLAAPPAGDVRTAIAARRIGDHRKLYLDYEGPVSGDRGTVRRYDAGTYRLLQSVDNCWVLDLRGGVLSGRFELWHDSAEAPERWIFRSRDDSALDT